MYHRALQESKLPQPNQALEHLLKIYCSPINAYHRNQKSIAFLIAKEYSKKDSFDLSRKYFELATRDLPTNAKILYEYALMEFKLENHEKSLSLARQAYAYDKSYGFLIDLLIKLNIKLHKIEPAKHYLEILKVIILEPTGKAFTGLVKQREMEIINLSENKNLDKKSF